MKKYIFLLAAILTTGFTACSDDPTIAIQESSEIQKIETNDYETIVNVARHSVSVLQGDAASRARSLTVKTFTSYPELSSRADNTSSKLHIVNFLEGGFAIVGDIHDGYCVYAMSDEGSFDPQPGSAPELFMDLAFQHKNENPIIPFDLSDPVPYDPTVDNYVLVWHGNHYCRRYIISTYTSEKSALLKTAWHQYSPYNKFCFTQDGMQALAGCGPIAMGQVMAYYKKPAQFNGHIYDWTLSNSQSIGYLISDIGLEAGCIYGTDATSTYLKNVVPTLKAFGYTSSENKDYSDFEIRTNLDSEYPVLAYGSGYSLTDNTESAHLWVIDGYSITTKEFRFVNDTTGKPCSTGSNSTVYVHCNWGWGGSQNGLFLSKVFNLGSFSFSENLKLISNIH